MQALGASGEGHSGMAVYLRLFSYAARYWGIFVLAILGMVVVAASATAFTALMQPLMDGSFVERDPETIRWVPPALIGIYFVRAIGAFVSGYGMSLVGRNVIYNLRNEMFARLLALPKAYYDQATTGELMSRFTYDVEQVANASTRAITVFIRDALTIVGLVIWMFYLNAMLAAVFMIVAPLVSMLVIGVSKRFRRISKRIQGSMGDVSRVLEEAIKGQQVVKIFGGEAMEAAQFEAVNAHNRNQQLKMQRTQALSSPVVQLIVACALALIIYLATMDGMIETITVGTFMSFLTAMFMMLPPIRAITSVMSELQRGIAAADSVFHFLDLETEKDTGTFTRERVVGEIDFRHVGFRYQADKPPALAGIDLHIEPGTTVAFVGRSGSGKSTLLNLLPRLYDVSEGAILLDGRDVRDYRLASLRAQISYVGQDVVLFNDSIAHNIAYGQMQNASREQIEAAARAAHAWDFIRQMPQGLDSMVGERGVMLSGGQRQRIAIARALLKDAPLLILDEATSALDTESERIIQQSLEELMQNRTTLVIAHRLSTIENADVIVVMEGGRIVETGSHAELLAAGGAYAALHRIQFQDPAPLS